MSTMAEQLSGSRLTGAVEVVPAAGDERARGAVTARVAGPGEPWLLELSGWALGTAAPVVAIELALAGSTVWRLVPGIERPDVAAAHPGVAGAGRCGFEATVSALALPVRFELELRAVLEGSAAERPPVPIATLRGARPALPGTASAGPAPLVITATDAAGAALVGRLLAAHPAIAAHRPGEPESRVAGYWAAFLRELSEPESYARALAPGDSQSDPSWWLAPPRPSLEELISGQAPAPFATAAMARDRPLYDALGHDTVAAVAAFTRGRVEQVYRWIAADQGKPGAAFVAERCAPGPLPALVGELFTDARELVLAGERDRPGAGMPAERTRLVRLEQLEAEPERTLEGLPAWLRLDEAGGDGDRAG